jgi:predicted PurR-regulated permease PerM
MTAQRSSLAVRTIAVVLVAAALALGRDFFIPIALALAFHALFSPVVRRLEKARLPAPLGAAIVVLGGLALFGIGGWALSGPIETWVEKAPASIATARKKLSSFGGPLSRLSAAASGGGAPADTAARPAPPPPPPPRPTESTAPAPPFLTQLLGRAAAVVGLVVQVVVLLYIMLAMGGMLFRKLVNVVPGPDDKRTASDVLHQTESIVSSYLVITTLINAGQGVVVGLAMWAIGMPNPLIWGLLTFAFEFIPFLGGIINVALLLVGGMTAFTSVGQIVLPAIVYLVITTIQNNVVSPFAYGGRLKLNPLAVMICVLFWWFIWGVPGAFLAIPIAATLKVLGDEVPRLAPMGELLGDRPAGASRLTPG